ncbi:MAG: hypothetical protein ACRCVW_06010 [Brevinema sp.]
MQIFVNFLSLLVFLSFIVGIILLIVYAISNSIMNTRWFYSLPRYVRNGLDSIVSFCGNMGPFFIIFFILAQFALSLLKNFLY